MCMCVLFFYPLCLLWYNSVFFFFCCLFFKMSALHSYFGVKVYLLLYIFFQHNYFVNKMTFLNFLNLQGIVFFSPVPLFLFQINNKDCFSSADFDVSHVYPKNCMKCTFSWKASFCVNLGFGYCKICDFCSTTKAMTLKVLLGFWGNVVMVCTTFFSF